MITKLYVNMLNYLNKLKNDEKGVTAIEYGLIAVAMATMLIAVFYTDATSFVDTLETSFATIRTNLSLGD
ncbi:Flp family type IVb pilin [Vibrio sp. 10N.222.55.A3]|uniref:Flp family type IVb pilin n=1 Tax=unclassified Vibrio TaxID=2614977 RepID=UPI001E2B39E0|nr:Flp family type IVb pilin [Vibrio sp. F13]MCC4890152.1 Flp family type IVb pilin [Vibrio sp. F13]